MALLNSIPAWGVQSPTGGFLLRQIELRALRFHRILHRILHRIHRNIALHEPGLFRLLGFQVLSVLLRLLLKRSHRGLHRRLR